MPTKIYYFDFYECVTRSSNPNAVERTTSDMLRSFFEAFSNGGRAVREISGKSYEIRHIEETDYGFKGVIGKHRKSDLPHAAVIGGEEREIVLNPDENLLEKAHFSFYEDYQLLIVQRNHYCISSNNLGKFLSGSSYVTVLNPIIEAEDLRWLMDGNVKVRTAEIAIARPRNPDLFRNIEHDFNNSIIGTLNGSGTAMLNLSLRGNARSDDSEQRYLASTFKRALREMQSTFDVRKCKLLLEEEGSRIIHPVDLVADRLIYYKPITVEGRYPPTFEMWEAIEEARSEKESELINYFGDLTTERLA